MECKGALCETGKEQPHAEACQGTNTLITLQYMHLGRHGLKRQLPRL